MKRNTITAGVLGCILTVAIVGCDSKTSSSAPTVDDAKKATENTASAVQAGAEKAVGEVKAAGEKVVTEVKQAGEKAIEGASKLTEAPAGEVNGLIEKAKGFIAEKKYQEALKTVTDLKGLKLTADQQKMVDDLKAQAEKLVSGDAAKAVGNLLGK
ncbi:MAG: hypothetical protein U1F65_10905 [Verrucomicrobiota bacterium]